MNKFQAMARIMAMLCEDGGLIPGSRKYKFARQLISRKIDSLGPDAVFSQVKWNKNQVLERIDTLSMVEDAGGNLAYFDFW